MSSENGQRARDLIHEAKTKNLAHGGFEHNLARLISIALTEAEARGRNITWPSTMIACVQFGVLWKRHGSPEFAVEPFLEWLRERVEGGELGNGFSSPEPESRKK